MEVINSKNQKYYLHGKQITLLHSGANQMIYWFSKEVNETTLIPALPEGYEVTENPRSKLPLLKKVR